MTGLHQRSQSRTAHAVRVAVAAASLVAVLYVAVVVSFDVVDTRHLVGGVDSLVKQRLALVKSEGKLGSLGPGHLLPSDNDVDDAPVVLWLAPAHGGVEGLTVDAPPLPAGRVASFGPADDGLLGLGAVPATGRPGGDVLVDRRSEPGYHPEH